MANRKAFIFLAYSPNDEDLKLKDDLIKYLNGSSLNGNIEIWEVRKILAGSLRDKEILDNLKKARFILLLISADFLAEGFIKTIELYKPNNAQVIPILLRHCDWQEVILNGEKLESLQYLPMDRLPVERGDNNKALYLTEITKEISRLLTGKSPKSRYSNEIYTSKDLDLNRLINSLPPSSSLPDPQNKIDFLPTPLFPNPNDLFDLDNYLINEEDDGDLFFRFRNILKGLTGKASSHINELSDHFELRSKFKRFIKITAGTLLGVSVLSLFVGLIYFAAQEEAKERKKCEAVLGEYNLKINADKSNVILLFERAIEQYNCEQYLEAEQSFADAAIKARSNPDDLKAVLGLFKDEALRRVKNREFEPSRELLYIARDNILPNDNPDLRVEVETDLLINLGQTYQAEFSEQPFPVFKESVILLEKAIHFYDEAIALRQPNSNSIDVEPYLYKGYALLKQGENYEKGFEPETNDSSESEINDSPKLDKKTLKKIKEEEEENKEAEKKKEANRFYQQALDVFNEANRLSAVSEVSLGRAVALIMLVNPEELCDREDFQDARKKVTTSQPHRSFSSNNTSLFNAEDYISLVENARKNCI